ncbi:MAG: transporter substrate-binding domain-containing protein, partial [Treponema sp.]|nr:transporter substrate-binding domain-containing protein [Treponema sp.]
MKRIVKTVGVAITVAGLFSFASCQKKNSEKTSKPVIKIACAQDEGVISYVDENDHLTGEEVEVWREIAKRIPEYDIQFIATGQDDVRIGIQTGIYDGSIADFFLTKERLEKFEIPREPLDF